MISVIFVVVIVVVVNGIDCIVQMNVLLYFIIPIAINDIDLSDVVNYPDILTPDFREKIVHVGPIQIKMSFPSTNGRSFSESFYTKRMANGEDVRREWIVYSRTLDSVHCFCCFLFGENQNVSGVSSKNGISDWKHLSTRISEHEHTKQHMKNYAEWKLLENRISNKKTIDLEIRNQMKEEIEKLRQVFKRIVPLILFFARQNIALTGKSSNIRDSTGHNGNFQQLIHTIATFDTVLKEHLQKSGKIHYLSPKIQNELIAIIGSKVQKQILENVKKSKYYSIILDSTTDITRIEQLTVVLRYVFLNKDVQMYEIKESFIKFIDIHDKTGQGISDAAIRALESADLNIDDIRGQAYDNGANMKGKNIGVQKVILLKNPRAFFVACCDHSLNLVLNDAAAASNKTVGFFSMVQKIYTFLSGSSNRWDVLKSHLTNTELTPKDTNPTRWSGRVEAVKPLKLNPDKIHAALKQIENSSSFDSNVRFTAGTIAEKMDFEFILSVCIWYDILTKVNIASKALQSITSNLQAAMISLENVATFLEEYKLNGYGRARGEAEKICEQLGFEAKFIEIRKRNANREIIDPEENFRQNFFSFVMEVALNSITERFEALKNHNELFSFLYDFQNMEENARNGNLLQSCKRLESALSHNGSSDIDGDDLFVELSLVPSLVKSQNINKIIDVLNTIMKSGMENLLPNAAIAYRILLTSPVSVASGERSFSKLKIIKNYLRNSMNQERLNELAIISIEHDIANSIEYDDVIDDFAKSKARKKNF